jgi:uncharacterized protein
MQLTQDAPDHRFQLRSADGTVARVNELELRQSFLLTPERLVEGWRPRAIGELEPTDMDAVLALEPALVLLGSGARLAFPAPAIMAACLTRGIGIEVMDNAAAARTFNLLAGEGRRVVAAFLL